MRLTKRELVLFLTIDFLLAASVVAVVLMKG